MIIIGNTIISEDILNIKFACDLATCHGACCVEGDAGAPLEIEEISLLEDYIEQIKSFMTPAGIDVIARSGVFDYDIHGHFVTPLVNDLECAFVFFENGVARCAIEKAYDEKKIRFRKPVSCHIYPIRIQCFNNFDALNYHSWSICTSALKKGIKDNTYLFHFLKEPLIRKYGDKWFRQILRIKNGKAGNQ
jgi:hypothetical protein